MAGLGVEDAAGLALLALVGATAVIRQQELQNLPDVLKGKGRPTSTASARKPVGRMRLDVRLRPEGPPAKLVAPGVEVQISGARAAP